MVKKIGSKYLTLAYIVGGVIAKPHIQTIKKITNLLSVPMEELKK